MIRNNDDEEDGGEEMDHARERVLPIFIINIIFLSVLIFL